MDCKIWLTCRVTHKDNEFDLEPRIVGNNFVFDMPDDLELDGCVAYYFNLKSNIESRESKKQMIEYVLNNITYFTRHGLLLKYNLDSDVFGGKFIANIHVG